MNTPIDDVEQLRDVAENGDFAHAWSRAEAYFRLAQALQLAGMRPETEQALWEAQLFRASMKYPEPGDRVGFRFLEPFVEGVPLQLLSDQRVVDYFQQRAEVTSRPDCRTRYADAVFSSGRKRYWQRAIKAYHDLIVELKSSDEPSHHWVVCDALRRSLQIGLAVNARDVNLRTAEAIVHRAGDYADARDYRWAIEAAESLFLDRNRRLDVQLYRNAVAVMELTQANTQNSWDLHEQATECLAQLFHVLGDAPAAAAARRRHVNVLVEEAERQSLHLLKMEFYTRARDLLANLGTDRTLLDDLTRKVEQETQAAVSKGEFKPIPVAATGPIETIRSCLIGSGVTQTLHNIALLPLFPNDVQELEAEVREARRQAPLVHSIPHLVVRQGRPAYRSEAADDWSDYIRHLGFRWHIYGLAVASVVEEGLTQGWLKGENIMRFVESGAIIPRSKHPFLQRAVDALCRMDYVTVIHLLVPHLEDTLRSCIGLLERPTSSMRGGRGPSQTIARRP